MALDIAFGREEGQDSGKMVVTSKVVPKFVAPRLIELVQARLLRSVPTFPKTRVSTAMRVCGVSRDPRGHARIYDFAIPA
jgi:hypothetical protein